MRQALALKPSPVLAEALKMALAMEEEGLTWEDAEYQKALNAFLSATSSSKCKCGKELLMYQMAGGRCEPCAHRQLAHLEGATGHETREAKMATMGIPPRYYDAIFANWVGDVPTTVDDWLASPMHKNLVIWGPHLGVGKSMLAVATLYSVTNRGYRGYWYSSAVLAQRLAEETFAKEKSVEPKTAKVQFLVLDDLGKNEDDVVPGGFNKVAALLDLRDQYKKPTIVTTNLTPQELLDRNKPLASRLLSGVKVELKGGDKRWG